MALLGLRSAQSALVLPSFAKKKKLWVNKRLLQNGKVTLSLSVFCLKLPPLWIFGISSVGCFFEKAEKVSLLL